MPRDKASKPKYPSKTHEDAAREVFTELGYQALFSVLTGLKSHPRAISELLMLRLLMTSNPKRSSVERQFSRLGLKKGTDFTYLYD